MRYIGIWKDKIFDITSDLKNKRTKDNGIPLTQDELESIKYIEYYGDSVVDDTWDEPKNESLKDSPRRTPVIVKTAMDLKLEELESRIEELEKKGKQNEKK